ncbi:MAG: hypothetical protein HKN51_04755 [Saprospiraceae bacterium]|nr:hypothetical protein [Bacteroidia bacterium]NNE14261.1 hypothetical protein [Saprospiraceae bacterium]
MKLPFIAFVLFTLLGSCKSTQFTPYNFEGVQLIFGQGGGFTGQVNEFTLLENGQLFAGTNQEGFVDELKPLDKNQSKQIFNISRDLGIEAIELDDPGNQYFYIIVKDGEKKNKLQWGANRQTMPNELKILFENLKNLTKQRVLSNK